jgi:DNA-binding CsgD family transcriptional regulator
MMCVTIDAYRTARAELRDSDDLPALKSLLAQRVLLAQADARELHARERALVEIQRAIGRLRRCTTREQLVRRTPGELCRACGFTRAMIARVDRRSWIPILPPAGTDRDADTLRAELGENPTVPIAHMLPEAEMIRRRIPIRVSGAERPLHSAVERLVGHGAYVAAPIISGRRVIGLIHADRSSQPDELTDNDRDDLALFAEYFGLLHDRAVLAEEIERRSRAVARLSRQMLTGLTSIEQREPQLAPAEPLRLDDAPSETPQTRLELLTARERQILELVAAGATNRSIARELVLSDNTVKTHVATATRKLGARSRGDAVARYLGSLNQTRT